MIRRLQGWLVGAQSLRRRNWARPLKEGLMMTQRAEAGPNMAGILERGFYRADDGL